MIIKVYKDEEGVEVMVVWKDNKKCNFSYD